MATRQDTNAEKKGSSSGEDTRQDEGRPAWRGRGGGTRRHGSLRRRRRRGSGGGGAPLDDGARVSAPEKEGSGGGTPRLGDEGAR